MAEVGAKTTTLSIVPSIGGSTSDPAMQTSSARPFTDRHVAISNDLSVSYRDFDPSRMSFGVPEDKTPDPSTKIPPYSYVPIQYRYLLEDGRECTKDLFISSPRMLSPKGVLDSYAMDDKERTGPIIGQTLGVDFNVSIESHAKYMKALVQIYIETVKFLNHPDTKKSPIGSRLNRFYAKGSEKINYEEMTNPEMAWSGCSFIVSYRKQGSSYILTSTPSLWSKIKKGKKSTLFVDKRREKDKDGNNIVDSEGKPKFSLIEIDKSVIEVSALDGYFCHHIQGVNANTNTAKIKVMLDQVIVKSVSSKMNSIKKTLADEDEEEEDEDTLLLADSISLLMPEAEANAQQKAQQKAREAQETPPDTVAKSAASVGGGAFSQQQQAPLQLPPPQSPQQHSMLGPQQFYQPSSTQMQRYQNVPTFQPDHHHLEQMGGYPTVQGMMPQQYTTRPQIQDQWGSIGQQ